MIGKYVGSVYVLAAPDGLGKTYFKVGWTTDIAKRIRALQTGCPLRIRHVWMLPLWSGGAAQSLEAILHQMLRPYHSHGEWFLMQTDNLDHKRDMNRAFAKGVEFAGMVMTSNKWKSVNLEQMWSALTKEGKERSEKRRGFIQKMDQNALLRRVKAY